MDQFLVQLVSAVAIGAVSPIPTMATVVILSSGSTGFRMPEVEPGQHARAAETESDYRYTLANQRTFLAYIRAALGLDAAALSAAQFLPPSAGHLRLGIVVLLTVLGVLVALLGYRRWQRPSRPLNKLSGDGLAHRAWEQAVLFGAQFVFTQRVTELKARGNERVVALNDGSEWSPARS
jgi:uncharacterized membrane protein YidH (DUF202 family)